MYTDSIMIFILGFGALIAIITLIIGGVCSILYKKRPLDYKGTEAMELILYAAAFAIVTKGMTSVQIYKQRGSGIRVPVERKIREKVYHLQDEYLNPQFIAQLQKQELLSADMVIRANACDPTGRLLALFLAKQNKTTMDDGIPPARFFALRKKNPLDIPGVYILYNRTKNKYYVGQAKKLFFRINQHFMGHGNGDVYADYKYGDDFLIRWVPLEDSGFPNLNSLEKHNILKYDAVSSGYNRTAGNN